jgi:rod shape-determining protein MreD
MDVHTSSLMGEHALAYTLMSYCAISLHRRVAWFTVWGQMIHILPLFVGCQLVTVAIRLIGGGMLPPWWMIFQGLATTLLWPLAVILLMAPQHRPTDRDDTRPL